MRWDFSGEAVVEVLDALQLSRRQGLQSCPQVLKRCSGLSELALVGLVICLRLAVAAEPYGARRFVDGVGAVGPVGGRELFDSEVFVVALAHSACRLRDQLLGRIGGQWTSGR